MSIAEITRGATAIAPSRRLIYHLHKLFGAHQLAGKPRYYQSIVALSSRREYLHTYYRDCLLVLKKKWIMGKPVLYLLLPPVHKHRDLRIEGEVLAELRGLGIGARLTDEDIDAYGIDRADARLDSVEWLYRAGDWRKAALCGYRLRRDRNKINQAERTKYGGGMSVKAYGAGDTSFSVAAGVALAQAWGEQKKDRVEAGKSDNARRSFRNERVPHAFWDVHTSPVGILTRAHVLTCVHHKQAGFSYTESVAGGVVIILRLRNYDCTCMPTIGVYMHHLDLNFWSLAATPDTIVTYGGGTSESGEAHKKSLHPIGHLDIYAVRGMRPITAEEWKSSCQPLLGLSMVLK